MKTSEIILSLERESLENWSNGNPSGYFVHASDDVTYFDDIRAQNRMEGLESITSYAKTLEEMIPPHKYKMVNPKVQVYGDMAILSYHYHPFTLEGEPSTKWRASVVYSNIKGRKMVHAHWTMEKVQE